jgi:AcrR family transcriptional regulator
MTTSGPASATDAGHSSVDRSARRPGRPANTSTDATVAAVLTAARRQFAARGYAGTSNRTVAAAAGLAHTAIYNHFGSKARLFTAVFVDVQDLLIAELERSARAAPTEPPLPRALLDAIEALRAADPSYVEFLASMYVEVRRHPELRQVFQGGDPFPALGTLRELAAEHAPGGSGADVESSTWLWISFGLGLAQLGSLADERTFATTVDLVRRGVSGLHGTDVAGPSSSGGAGA